MALEAPLLETGWKNHDNGVLHIQILQFLKDKLPKSPADCWPTADEALKSVMRAFYAVGEMSSYDIFVARVKLALGSQRDFGELLIQRRGLGFCADDTEHAPVSFDSNYSFCFHAVKGVEKALESLTGCLDLVLECSEPQTSCKGNMDSIRGTMLRQFQPTRPGLGQVNDIEDCWPHCSQEIPSSVWKKIAKGLASYSGCWHWLNSTLSYWHLTCFQLARDQLWRGWRNSKVSMPLDWSFPSHDTS